MNSRLRPDWAPAFMCMLLLAGSCSPAPVTKASRVDTTLPPEAAAAGQTEAEIAAAGADTAQSAAATAADAAADAQRMAEETAPAAYPPSQFAETAEPAATTPSGPFVITQPDWLRRPSSEDLNRYFPDRASRMGVDGRATISCNVNSRGLLEDCSIVSEEPDDQGFGDAALKMSRLFKMRPMSRDGVPVDGGTVRIPLRFNLPTG